MSVTKSWPHAAALLASLGLLMPQSAYADPARIVPQSPQPSPEPSRIGLVLDVALDAAGVLHGQVVDQDGAPLARVPVDISQQQRQIGATLTGSDGYFAIAGLRGGIYQIGVGQNQTTWRVWAPGAAPPSSRRAAMLVTGGVALRGQNGARRFVIPTLILAGLIGTAIAVPLAISNSNNDGS
jgi:hypothetical protein